MWSPVQVQFWPLKSRLISKEPFTIGSPAHSSVSLVVLGNPPNTSQVIFAMVPSSTYIVLFIVSVKLKPFIRRKGKSGGGSGEKKLCR